MKQIAIKSTIICLALILIFNVAAYAQGFSNVAELLFEVGKEYYERGDYDQALHEFEKALLADPQHAKALMYIKIIEDELGVGAQPFAEEIEWEEALTQPFAEEIEREEALTQALQEAQTQIAAWAEEEVVEAAAVVVEEAEEILPVEVELEQEELAAEETAEEVAVEEAPVEEAVVEEDEEGAEAVPAQEPVPPEGEAEALAEEAEQEPPVKISGEYTVSLGGTEGDVIWKDAHGDYNEANWRRIDKNFGINTYDTRVYDRLRVNLDTENEEGFNFHSNLTIDPWTFIGKSDEVTLTSGDGDTVDVQLKYWSNTSSTINESAISTYSSGVADSFSLPEMKLVDGKVAAFTARGIEYDSGFDTLAVPEMEIHRELWPVRELWFDYNKGDKFQFRFFPIAYQDQALTSDDPLQLSNHMIYWEESPWLDRWQPGILNTGGTSLGAEDFTKGEWEDDLSFFTRDSNLTRLTSLRGYSLKTQPWENVSIESTVASPKGLWQDYDAFDNIEGATRIKFTPDDKLQLGLINTFRYGLEESNKDAENRVIGGDIAYQFTPNLQMKAEAAYSRDERDLTQEPYDTKNVGNAYRFELQKGKVQEERPEPWDEEAQKELEEAKAEPFNWALRLTYTRMDKGFYPALANYRLSRKDPFWGRHIHFEQPYQEYYSGLYYPSLTWEDIRPYRIGDSVDIDRDVGALRLEKAFLGGKMETLFDCRNAHEASSGQYIETVARTETSWQVNDKLLIKLLGIYHDLPDTTGGIDPILYDVDTNKFLANAWIEDEKNPSLKTVSTGFKYDFWERLSFDFIYEYTNDFTVGLDDYPRRLLNNPNFTTYTEDGLNWQESEPYLYDQYLFPIPPYPWFNIYKAGLNLKPNDNLKLRLEFTKNDYKFASQIDDNINHLGLEADWDITDNLALKCNYTFSRSYNVQGRGEGLDYRRHHNVFVNVDYKMEDKGVFSLQYGEAAILPYTTMFTTSPYGGFLPTLDTAHIVRAYFSRRF